MVHNSPSAVMAEAMRCIAYPSAIHDKRPHSTGDRGPTRAMHLMREEKSSLDSGLGIETHIGYSAHSPRSYS